MPWGFTRERRGRKKAILPDLIFSAACSVFLNALWEMPFPPRCCYSFYSYHLFLFMLSKWLLPWAQEQDISERDEDNLSCLGISEQGMALMWQQRFAGSGQPWGAGGIRRQELSAGAAARFLHSPFSEEQGIPGPIETQGASQCLLVVTSFRWGSLFCVMTLSSYFSSGLSLCGLLPPGWGEVC